MFKFISLHCHSCNSVIANLPDNEAKKLNGLTFQCECCNHLNLLDELTFIPVPPKHIQTLLSA